MKRDKSSQKPTIRPRPEQRLIYLRALGAAPRPSSFGYGTAKHQNATVLWNRKMVLFGTKHPRGQKRDGSASTTYEDQNGTGVPFSIVAKPGFTQIRPAAP